ncbi:MAG: O-antigen ligase family protein [Pseudomonadota bacterium]
MAVTDALSVPRDAPAPLQVVTGRLPLVIWIYLLAVIIPIGFQVGPLLLTGLRLTLMVMIIPVLIRLFTGHYGRIIVPDVLFVLHLLWTMLALAANNPGSLIEQTGSTGMEFLGGYALGRAYIRSREDFAALIRALIWMVLVMLPFAMFETVTGRSLWLEALRAVPGVKTVWEIPSEARTLFGVTLERVQLGFAHPIHFGLFCSVTFSLCVVGMKGILGTPRRLLSGACLALAGVLSLSSGALLAMILQAALITWALVFAQVSWRWWLLVGIGVLTYIGIDLASERTPIRVFMSYATFSAHNAFWRATIFEWGMKNVWANPILGLGLKDWVRPDYMIGSSVDNFWLLMAMRYGIPGFVFVTLGYLWVVVQLMRRDFHADPVLTQFRLAWVFTFLGLSFTLCTVHVWTAIYSFTFFMLGAGVWLMFAMPEDPKGESTATDETRQSPPFARDFDNAAVLSRQTDAEVISPRETAPRYSRFAGPKDR